MTGSNEYPQPDPYRAHSQMNVGSQISSFYINSAGNAGDVTLYDPNSAEWDQLFEGPQFTFEWDLAWNNLQHSNVPTSSNAQLASNALPLHHQMAGLQSSSRIRGPASKANRGNRR